MQQPSAPFARALTLATALVLIATQGTLGQSAGTSSAGASSAGASAAAPDGAGPGGAASLPAATDGAAPSSEVPWVFPPSGPFSPETVAVPNAAEISAWARSGHADAGSRSFSYWNESGSIPPACASCHSGAGFRAFHGLDGSAPGPLDQPIPTGGVVDCATCHNPGLSAINEITLPNGMIHPVPPGEATCLTCHQGRASGQAVTAATAELPPDTPDGKLSFINPHYGIAGASWLGGYAGLGYEYPGKSYAGRFTHAPPVATCNSCHEPHSLDVAEEGCRTCHATGNSADIRVSRVSHDGSGVTTKGIRADIDANAARLKSMLLDYASRVAGSAMIYDGERHPYFFADANGDGVVDQTAEGRPQPYNSWTPRLLRGAYNWKFVGADPGIHVHNPVYALQLLHDSIEDLAGPLGVDFAGLGLVR